MAGAEAPARTHALRLRACLSVGQTACPDCPPAHSPACRLCTVTRSVPHNTQTMRTNAVCGTRRHSNPTKTSPQLRWQRRRTMLTVTGSAAVGLSAMRLANTLAHQIGQRHQM